MPWYAVKTFLRTRALGRARNRDAHFRAGVVAIEERVVIFRAKDFDGAIKKGETESRKYARAARKTNAYGQQVQTEVLGYVEAYKMVEAPHDGAEVFSSIEIARATESAKSIVDRKVGHASNSSTARLFISREVARRLDDQAGDW